jgi:hypothetical protein
MLDYCQYKLVAANAHGSGEYFCGKDQLTGHCCDAQKEPPKDEPEPIPCSNCKGTGVEHSIWSVGNSSGMSSGTCRVCKGTGQKPIQKEPELWICDHAERCNIEICNHIWPHKRLYGCDKPTCDSKNNMPVKCIPYKKEPTVPQEPDRPCQACIEGNAPHCSKPFPDCPYHGDPEPVPKDGAALEKDIGDLTQRMDLVDSRQAHDFRMITHLNKVLSIVGEFGSDRLYKIEERIGALEKKVK